MKLLFFFNMQIFKLHLSGRIKLCSITLIFHQLCRLEEMCYARSKNLRTFTNIENTKLMKIILQCSHESQSGFARWKISYLWMIKKAVLNSQLFFHRTERLSFFNPRSIAKLIRISIYLKPQFWRQKKSKCPSVEWLKWIEYNKLMNAANWWRNFDKTRFCLQSIIICWCRVVYGGNAMTKWAQKLAHRERKTLCKLKGKLASKRKFSVSLWRL